MSMFTIYNHRTHSSTTFPTRTGKFQYSFFPHRVNMWENLSKFITKSRYSDFLAVKPNSIFNVHTPIGLKYLTRLRVGFSLIKSHKYNRNFGDTFVRHACVMVLLRKQLNVALFTMNLDFSSSMPLKLKLVYSR